MQDKVPVTLRALTQRINRQLMKEEQVLKKVRGRALLAAFGQYYMLDSRSNYVLQGYIDPVALATELGVLQPWETVHEEEKV